MRMNGHGWSRVTRPAGPSGPSLRRRGTNLRGRGANRRVRGVLCALLVLAANTAAARSPQAASPLSQRPVSQFPGLGRLFREVSRDAARGADAAGRLFDFEQVVVAVAGRADAAGHSLDEYRRGFAGETLLALPTAGGSTSRDDAAYRLHSVGYSAREIADILGGRISRAALDQAHRMLMVGRSAEQASDFLDREYRRVADARARAENGRAGGTGARASFEGLVAKYATLHQVDVALVKALVEVESGWNQSARSRAGAIGLMQLMPGTARELQVNPFEAEQNVEGGVRYLAWLLRGFGGVERALIAYNAGPGFAARLARGEAALYGETRDYVRRVLSQLR
jgi:soluble lytic murein transglycosylase-like protein